MTDHLKASIDQIFPPEPPDDPAPEPVPPADDALPACPGCGLSNGYTAHDGFCTCKECGFTITPDDWRRLARAVALLRAVERLDNPAWSLKLTPGIRSRWQCDYNTLPATRLVAETIADALIALAAQLEARND